mgnify:CR=1 FL=1
MAQTKANQKIKRPDIKFYLYDKKDNKLRMRETKIFSPFNVKTKWFETDKFWYIEPTYVKFEADWTYKLSLRDVWSEILYDQIKEFLSFFNREWWTLTKWNWISEIKNWLRVSAKRKPYYVSMSEIKDESKTETKEVIKEVQIQTLPRVVAEWMDFTQLRELAKAWWVEIPEDIGKSQKPEEIKKEFLNILSEHITD